MRVALHEQLILEGSRFSLVGVAGDVLRVRRFLVDELPLHSSGKPGAAAASQARCLDDVDDLVGFERKRFSQAIVALVFQVEVERKGIRLADVLSEQGFHLAVPVNHEATKSTKTDHFQVEKELRETSCSSCLRGLKSFLLGLDDMVTRSERGFGARAETIDQ